MVRAIASLCFLVYAEFAAFANPNPGKLEFDAASVKPSARSGSGAMKVDPGGPGSGDPSRLTYRFATIRDLIVDGFGVRPYQISGGPSWLDSAQFDILAKVPPGATKEQARVMLQNLLAERFHLTLHRETKDLPIYALVAGPKGVKLKDSIVTDTRAGDAPPPLPPASGKERTKIGPDGCPEMSPVAGAAANFMMITPNGVCMIAWGQTMEGLATQLSDRFDRPVVDETGLKDRYDWRLRYDPSSMPGGRGGAVQIRGGVGGEPPRSDPSDSAPSIFSALQEQLGLKLEPRKGLVELLVIDHADRTPTAN